MREIRLPREKMERSVICTLVPNAKARPYTWEFIDFLATQCKEDTTDPERFRLNVELSFIALSKGVDDFTGEPIRHIAAHQVPRAEMEIRKDLPAVFRAIFSAEDAAALKEYEDSLPTLIYSGKKFRKNMRKHSESAT